MILTILTPVFIGTVTGLVGLVAIWMNRIQTKEKARIAHAQALDDIKIMQENSKLAVQAADQLGEKLTNEEKSNMALTFAQTWNKLAGVNTSAEVIIPMNEGYIPNLPRKEEERKNCVKTEIGVG